MRLSAIVAMSQNRVIGNKNQLPWKLPEDLKKFREITSGHPIVMGRKTFESIGRVLPHRENVIISRQAGYHVQGARVVQSLEQAIDYYQHKEEELFIIGGSEIYRLAFPRIERLYLTLIHQDMDGDTFFPDFKLSEFREISREDHTGQFSYSFLILERKLKHDSSANAKLGLD